MAQQLRGSGGSPGIALGPAFQYQPSYGTAATLDATLSQAQERFAAAQTHVATHMRQLAQQEQQAGREESGQIFDFLELLAEDPTLTSTVDRHLSAGLPLQTAIITATNAMAADLAALDSAYHRERAADILALGRELCHALNHHSSTHTAPPPGSIVIAEDLGPAEVAELPAQIAGFVTAAGGPTSHTAILARARGIPAIVGIGPHILEIPVGTPIALDGNNATLIIAPSKKQRHAFQVRNATHQSIITGNCRVALADGRQIELWANIGHPSEVAHALSYGIVGIGLFRSEFLFLDRQQAPSEEEQYQAYYATLEALAGRPLVVRTLDIGGDKCVPYLKLAHEPNPVLGVRGMRLFRQFPDVMETQLRARLRAAEYGDLRIMLPMVTTPEDMLWARTHITRLANQLHIPCPPIGAMIETPAAALTIDLLAAHADFFSIGTNDLAQYTLAVDRGHAALATHYPADAPAVLRMVELAAKAAHQHNRPISVCGELAGIPASAYELVNLGITSLSMAPSAIAGVRKRLEDPQ